MFSVLFPGQGSQLVGMGKNLHNNFSYIKSIYDEADEILKFNLSKIIIEGPKDLLDQTENTQPAIFLTSYSIFKVIKNETSFNINKAAFFAGHSLGEYSALACAEAITFEQTLKLLKVRGQSMQNAVPKGAGAMLAVLGSKVKNIEHILDTHKSDFSCYIANDNSEGQTVISGLVKDIDSLSNVLKNQGIKNIKLPVSAPFHSILMNPATNIMKNEILKTDFKKPLNDIISNVNANTVNNPEEIKKLLIEQIEKPVRWRESIMKMIELNINKFIEIGPGKVLSGIVKRIDRNVITNQVNEIDDILNLKND